MDQGTLSGLLQIGVAAVFLGVVWLLARRLHRRLRKTDVIYDFTPDMVGPHRRVVEVCKRRQPAVWLHTIDGYRLRIGRIVKRGFVHYYIERLAPDTWMLVPGEQGVHESFLVSPQAPPVFRRIRALYADENSLRTVDEKPIEDMDEFRKTLLPALVVGVDDLVVLADQLERARPRAAEPGE